MNDVHSTVVQIPVCLTDNDDEVQSINASL